MSYLRYLQISRETQEVNFKSIFYYIKNSPWSIHPWWISPNQIPPNLILTQTLTLTQVGIYWGELTRGNFLEPSKIMESFVMSL